MFNQNKLTKELYDGGDVTSRKIPSTMMGTGYRPSGGVYTEKDGYKGLFATLLRTAVYAVSPSAGRVVDGAYHGAKRAQEVGPGKYAWEIAGFNKYTDNHMLN